MKYDFDRVIDRRNTYSVKYGASFPQKPDDILPLWIADMDFQSPPMVIESLVEQSRHGIFGYSDTDGAYFEALRSWFKRRHEWSIERDWLLCTPGIVTAVHVAVMSLTQPGDAVLIQPPVYHPFSRAVRMTGRKLVENILINEKGAYSIDFDDMERKITENNVKLFILCSPHNPVGRIWSYEELTRMGDICVRHGVTVVSDEIHQDFAYNGRKHLAFAGLKPEYNDITVTCTAPTKTFNLAGLQISNIFIANAELRERFKAEYAHCGLSEPGIMGIVACRAAYEHGEDWLCELLGYLNESFSFLRGFLAEHIPSVKLIEPEGTYLAWLDFRELGLRQEELNELLKQKAKIWLNDGSIFGTGGEGFQRMNLACPRSILEEALGRLEGALAHL